jgi:acyl carrier protein
MHAAEIKDTVKAYILREFLPGEDPASLNDATELVTQGVLDSLASLKLVAFLEERYGITFAPHDVDSENLNTLNDIAALVVAKLAAR